MSVAHDRSASGRSMLLNSRGVWLKVAVFKEEKLDWRLTKMPNFTRYIGIDYSGAETADSSCKGIRVFMAEGSGTPEQVLIPIPPQWFWTRRGLAHWLCEGLGSDIPTI